MTDLVRELERGERSLADSEEAGGGERSEQL
jgi:hypothetical protein